MTAEIPTSQQTRVKFWPSFKLGIRENWLMYALFVVLVMAIAAFTVAINGLSRINEQNVQLKRLVACQNTYNEINNERTRQLAYANTRERDAEKAADSAFFAVVAAAMDGKQEEARKKMEILREKLAEQDAARQSADIEREQNPVPPPPNALCGSIPK